MFSERVAQYLSKGRPALVSGRLQSRSWEQDGQKRNKVEVVANDVTFLGGPGGASGQSAQVGGADEPTPAKASAADDTKKAAKKSKKDDLSVSEIKVLRRLMEEK